ncbi:MAG: hypothetical protein AAB263_17995 [Planctomycetota bacterium]
MLDVGWGTVNLRILEHAHALLAKSRRQPSFLIREATALSTSPSPATIAALLNHAGIDFVIIGAHALGVHTKEPRATNDVDIVVDDVPGAVAVLKSIKPRTRVLDLGAEVGKRITDAKGNELIDVLYPTGGVRGALFDNRTQVMLSGHKAFIPTLNAMLALKWLAMFSPSRSYPKRVQDRADFLRIIELHPKLNITPVAKLVAKAHALLAKQLVHDMGEYRKTGDLALFGDSF